MAILDDMAQLHADFQEIKYFRRVKDFITPIISKSIKTLILFK
jgi:hypothetical protein